MSDIIFIEPNNDHDNRVCALVLNEIGDEILVAMADSDVRLAGHLDLIFQASPTLPCAVAVFTHAVAWVSRDRVASTFGTVPDDVVDIVFDARIGELPPEELRGLHLASPLIDPRAIAQNSLATKWFDIIQ
jgi:hypothetical protein